MLIEYTKNIPSNILSYPLEPFLGECKDLDDYLFYLDEVLERIHSYFYRTLDAVKSQGGTCRGDPKITKFCSVNTLNPDVRVIVPETRRMTLKGCNIVFTGVVPTNIPLEKSKPWRTAIGLGARVTHNIVPKSPTDGGLGTTHVVAARHGTRKAFEASRHPDVHLVNPNWLWCAGDRWERPDEGCFPVPSSEEKNGKSSPVVSSRQGTPLSEQQPTGEQKNKTKQISPLAAKDFEIHGGPYDPANFLKEQISLPNFSKQELEAMDKEVEDLMQSGSDDETDSETTTPKPTTENDDGTTPPPTTTDPTTTGDSSKRKRKNSENGVEELGSVIGSKPNKMSKSSSKSSSAQSSDQSREQSSDSSSNESSGESNDEGGGGESKNASGSESGSSSSSSDDEDGEDSDSSSEEDENSMANMLERRMSECSDDS